MLPRQCVGRVPGRLAVQPRPHHTMTLLTQTSSPALRTGASYRMGPLPVTRLCSTDHRSGFANANHPGGVLRAEAAT